MASGDPLATFVPEQARFPSSDFATRDERGDHSVLLFEDTTGQTCYFSGWMPASYSGGGTKTTIVAAASAAVSGTIEWEVAYERHADDVFDLDTPSFATAQAISGNTATTSGVVTYFEVTHTDGAQMDSLAAGESFRISVARDPAGTDTVSGNAELVIVHIEES